ncbi:manganese/zinc/iron transport system ATP- binding protein [Arcanobacterium wilhelmae]|uniref:Manganese/zinc/iron transport system ATP-binding protein n=1 Tax=Arcanobacterium wilhelmae TaxID=1803177 RepID=A0ABT9N9G7_9ACTO|nr:metal ABC transporter ATP-binding protein [Arcanobacterium wilhelmae]MDP9800345.1 manganese/zinc/iron transport system ATP- binding protein [Arcanobacterium wilhelmae]WFN89781.1 metal ABC transporter ATP-binding protein [Arcanobacterium wilhelmae]
MTSPLELRNLSASYGQVRALKRVNITVEEGSVHAIVGPNGSGKSTSIKAALGLIASSGEARFFGGPLSKVRTRVAYMPQVAGVDWDFPITVADVVAMGTYPRVGWLKRVSGEHRRAAAEAIERAGLESVANRHISALSGGQKQRVFVARLLAQKADLLLMDEPFAGVDMASEATILDILCEQTEAGATIVLVHHNLATVSEFATHASLLAEGSVVATGHVGQVLAPDVVAQAYGIPAELSEAGSR